jgi:hypothetical protein
MSNTQSITALQEYDLDRVGVTIEMYKKLIKPLGYEKTLSKQGHTFTWMPSQYDLDTHTMNQLQSIRNYLLHRW